MHPTINVETSERQSGTSSDRWSWTTWMAAAFGGTGLLLQVILGVYLWSIEAPPPPGFGSAGLAISFGSVITGGALAIAGAAIGFVIDGIRSLLPEKGGY